MPYSVHNPLYPPYLKGEISKGGDETRPYK